MTQEYTTVRLLKTTRARLNKYGVVGDNMDQIVQKVLDKIEG